MSKPRKLTEAQMLARIKNASCPVCLGDDYSYCEPDMYMMEAHQAGSCESCGAHWDITYAAVSVKLRHEVQS